MRLSQRLVLLVAGCLLAGSVFAQAAPPSPLDALAHWVGGRWRGEFDAGNGRKFVVWRTYEWAFERRVLIGRSFGEREGKLVQTRHTVYWWNPEARRIEFTDFIDGGGYGLGFVEPRAGGLYMDAKIVGNDKHPAWRAWIVDEGRDAHTIRVEAERDGKWIEFGRYPYRRVDP